MCIAFEEVKQVHSASRTTLWFLRHYENIYNFALSAQMCVCVCVARLHETRLTPLRASAVRLSATSSNCAQEYSSLYCTSFLAAAHVSNRMCALVNAQCCAIVGVGQLSSCWSSSSPVSHRLKRQQLQHNERATPEKHKLTNRTRPFCCTAGAVLCLLGHLFIDERTRAPNTFNESSSSPEARLYSSHT